MLSILAIQRHEWRLLFLWIGLAIFADGFDGMLARRFRTKELAWRVDGALLDNILDYINYVLVPALFLVEIDLVPDGWALPTAALMLLSSAYQFTQVDAKTEDHYFKGFPSYWNVLVLYLFLFRWNVWINLAILLVCVVLVFVPVKYVYPSRTERNHTLNLILALAWGAAGVACLLLYPNVPAALLYLTLVFVAYYVVDSLVATLKLRRDASE
jgi:phosphatidylcholine synthase